jgi:hypothetical protein
MIDSHYTIRRREQRLDFTHQGSQILCGKINSTQGVVNAVQVDLPT